LQLTDRTVEDRSLPEPSASYQKGQLSVRHLGQTIDFAAASALDRRDRFATSTRGACGSIISAGATHSFPPIISMAILNRGKLCDSLVEIRDLAVGGNVPRMSLRWRKRQRVNATTSAKHLGKMDCTYIRLFSTLRHSTWAARLARRLHVKKGQSIDVDSPTDCAVERLD
jgi:hypothetical protein